MNKKKNASKIEEGTIQANELIGVSSTIDTQEVSVNNEKSLEQPKEESGSIGSSFKIRNFSSNPLPEYKSKQAAGMDICANLIQGFKRIAPGQRVLIPTGICVELPDGYEIQVRPRSGLALTNGITVLNSPGTIDPDYRGEIGIILINHSGHEFMVKHGDRIAQLVVSKFERPVFELVNENDSLSETERGSNGFGSTD